MYRIIGGDGKEYGPVNLEQVRQWHAEGRIGAQTQVQGPVAADWKAASEYPELQAMFGGAPAGPPPLPFAGPAAAEPQKALAVTSFVLGLLSLACFSIVTGIPAIVCGHVAHARARRSPAQYGGLGFAVAGFVMGYASLLFAVVILPALLLPALADAKSRATSISCVNNLKQIGLAFRIWAVDHNDQFPFNVSTNQGGTLELCARGPDGFDQRAAIHLLVLSNELSTPRILACPADQAKQPAFNFTAFDQGNVSYRLHSGTNISDGNPTETLAMCPVHGHILRCDGSVENRSRRRSRR